MLIRKIKIKKNGLKVIDESLRKMLFSVRTSSKLGKLMQNYNKRLDLDVSCFKFIFGCLSDKG